MTHTPPPAQPAHPPAPAGPGKKKLVAIVAGAAAVAFALGGGAALLLQGDDGQSDDKPSVAKATDTPTLSSPTPSASPSNSKQDLKIGDTADISAEYETSAAALAYDDTGITGVPELLASGQKWAVLMVKVCNRDTQTIQTSPLVWSLAYNDGVRVESSGMTAGELPQPLYPMDAKVTGGDCVKGNIAFQVPKDGRPERVLYSPDSLDEPVEWQVAK